MSDRAFLDTNVLIYLYSENEPDKRNCACQLLDTYNCVTSIQAFNEAGNVWLKKHKWSGTKVKEHLDNIELVCDDIIYVKRETINKALSLNERYGYSYFDCLMLASALENDCVTIYTEDMSCNQIVDGKLKIINPFA